MDQEGGSSDSCYYSILGIRRDASFSDVRLAYRKLALVIILSSMCVYVCMQLRNQNFEIKLIYSNLFDFTRVILLTLCVVFGVVLEKWHPDRCEKNQLSPDVAKQRFQKIQEAYSGDSMIINT